eukprot:SAG31_NODE_244_length_19246_cov_20.233823_9_plen_189_part_00
MTLRCCLQLAFAQMSAAELPVHQHDGIYECSRCDRRYSPPPPPEPIATRTRNDSPADDPNSFVLFCCVAGPKLRNSRVQRHVRVVTFSFLCPRLEKYGTFIARCNAIIENVSSFRSLRIARFQDWLLARPERCIVVVGHSAFFRKMVGQQHFPDGFANVSFWKAVLHGDGGWTDVEQIYEGCGGADLS